MDRPAVAPSTERFYEDLGEALTNPDAEHEWSLLRWVNVVCEAMIEPVDQYVRDRDEYPGWVIALDPDNAPVGALGYLAQFVGVTLEPKLTEAEQREKINAPEGFNRGTPAAIAAAVKRTLTGTKTVLITEREGGNAYRYRVRTYASETPDPAATEAVVRSRLVKPIGHKVFYSALEAQLWADVLTKHDTWADVLASYDDWAAVRSTLP